MSFTSFEERISRRFNKYGAAAFTTEDGKHVATFPEGVQIIGNAMSARVTVIWGSGHVAMATI